jgi:hypothetical protein
MIVGATTWLVSLDSSFIELSSSAAVEQAERLIAAAAAMAAIALTFAMFLFFIMVAFLLGLDVLLCELVALETTLSLYHSFKLGFTCV